jgi:hypothetical protein
VRQPARHVGWRLSGLFALGVFVLFLAAIVTLPEGSEPPEPEFVLTIVGILAAISTRGYVLLKRTGLSTRRSASAGFAVGLGPVALLVLVALVARLVR